MGASVEGAGDGSEGFLACLGGKYCVPDLETDDVASDFHVLCAVAHSHGGLALWGEHAVDVLTHETGFSHGRVPQQNQLQSQVCTLLRKSHYKLLDFCESKLRLHIS